jgi:chromosome segregation ATPase
VVPSICYLRVYRTVILGQYLLLIVSYNTVFGQIALYCLLYYTVHAQAQICADTLQDKLVYLRQQLDKQEQQFSQQLATLQHQLQKSSETLANERYGYKLQLDELKRSVQTAETSTNEHKCNFEQLQLQLATKDREFMNSAVAVHEMRAVQVKLQQSNSELQQQVTTLQQAKQVAEQSLQTSRKNAANLATTLKRYLCAYWHIVTCILI